MPRMYVPNCAHTRRGGQGETGYPKGHPLAPPAPPDGLPPPSHARRDGERQIDHKRLVHQGGCVGCARVGQCTPLALVTTRSARLMAPLCLAYTQDLLVADHLATSAGQSLAAQGFPIKFVPAAEAKIDFLMDDRLSPLPPSVSTAAAANVPASAPLPPRVLPLEPLPPARAQTPHAEALQAASPPVAATGAAPAAAAPAAAPFVVPSGHGHVAGQQPYLPPHPHPTPMYQTHFQYSGAYPPLHGGFNLHQQTDQLMRTAGADPQWPPAYLGVGTGTFSRPLMRAHSGVLPRLSGAGAVQPPYDGSSDEDEPAVGCKRTKPAKTGAGKKTAKTALQKSSESAVQQKAANGKAGAGKKACPVPVCSHRI